MDNFYAQCPAKINLFLKITGKRADGYHEAESLFAFLDLYDQLTITKADKFTLEIAGEFAQLLDQENNLFTQILDFFVKNFQISPNLQVKIVKNIPIGGGLGGGSSNAAYFMHGLNKIFALNLTIEQLQEISLNFGSDIAFLLANNAAIVRGRGEIIDNYPIFKPISALLINPKVFVSTKEVFSRFLGNFAVKNDLKTLLNSDIFDLLQSFSNDLQAPAVEILPLIAKIIAELNKNGAKIAKMSGSGASCFAIFDDLAQLNVVFALFKDKYPDFFVKKVKILPNV